MLGATMSLIPALAPAGIYGLEKLKGLTIVAAGQVEEVSCPPFGKYDCLTWPHDLYRMRSEGVCFTSSLMACSILGCKAIIAMARPGQPRFFVLERDDVTEYSMTLTQCPPEY